MLLELNGKKPEIAEGVFVAKSADIIGDVVIGEKSSIWFQTVLRGDMNSIRIGKYTNIQDHTVIHMPEHLGTTVGDFVTVGHRALIHGCKIGNNCLIGMGAIIMNGAEIGDNSIVGAGSLVTEGKIFPAGSLVMGLPAKVKREVTKEEIDFIHRSAERYFEYSKRYKGLSS